MSIKDTSCLGLSSFVLPKLKITGKLTYGFFMHAVTVWNATHTFFTDEGTGGGNKPAIVWGWMMSTNHQTNWAGSQVFHLQERFRSLMSLTQNKAWSKDCHGILVISQVFCYRSISLAPKLIHRYMLQHLRGTRLPGPSCPLIAHRHSCLGWSESAQKQHPDKLICVFPDSSHRLSLNFPPGSPKCQKLYSCGFLCIMSPC